MNYYNSNIILFFFIFKGGNNYKYFHQSEDKTYYKICNSEEHIPIRK